MRKLFFILMFILIVESVYSKVSFQRVKNVYSYVKNVSGFQIPLNYDNDDSADAYYYRGNIYITQGMLNILETDDEIAMVLGHEIAHHANQDYRSKESMAQELRADKDGYYYCIKMGKKNCLDLPRKMIRLFGNKPDDGIHPSWKVRLNKLKNN